MDNSEFPRLATQLDLANIRGFREISLRLSDITLLIGMNGSCKSTVLRALAMTLAPTGNELSALLGYSIGPMTRRGTASAKLELSVRCAGSRNRSRILVLSSSGDHEAWTSRSEDAHAFESEWERVFHVAYGAGRFHFGPGSYSSERGPSGNVSGLFNVATPFADPELTLRRLRDHGSDRYELLLGKFKQLLDLTPEDEIRIHRHGGLELDGPSVGGRIPLHAWADGYRVTFAWLLDLFAQALQADAFDEAGDIVGVLIIDEIEQHLHPSLQARILPKLRALLPRMQIIATTHSPLVTLGVRPEQIISLKRTSSHEVVQVPVPDVSRYSAEDVLTDERLFNTSALGPELAGITREYEDLVSLPPQRRTEEQQARIRSLVSQVSSPAAPADARLAMAQARAWLDMGNVEAARAALENAQVGAAVAESTDVGRWQTPSARTAD